MRSSTRTAIITSLLISTVVGAGFAMMMPAVSGLAAGQANDLEHQIATLTDKNRRLSSAVIELQMMMMADRVAANGDTEAAIADAPVSMALTALAATETRRRTDLASQAAATAEALDARFVEQRRQLFIQTPQCKKPDGEGLIICSITMRNNSADTLLVSFSQSGSRAVLTPEETFTSIRMRQLGQARFGYTATASIPSQDARSIEIAFGPTSGEQATARSIALSVNKMHYEFADVALND
jgi:hypothetical protein